MSGGYWTSWVVKDAKEADAMRKVRRYQFHPAEELYRPGDDPFEERNLADDPKHAETSVRLVSVKNIFPVGQIGQESEADQVERGRNMITVMRSWNDFNATSCFYPAAARIGHDPAEILRLLETWTGKKAANGMKHGNNPHGVESCTPSIATINLMLCTGHQDVLRVFHAWPKEMDAAFENLRVEGAFLVSSRLPAGRVEYLVITSERGRKCTIENPWPGKSVTVTRGDGGSEVVSGERFTIQTGIDETLRLVPKR